MSPRALIIVLVLVFAACSMFNRTGPSDTCAALQNGTVNACHDGILATCVGSQIVYKVCDDSSACEQSWQAAGAYKCAQTDPPFVPPMMPSGGSSGGARTSSSGGSSGGALATCGTSSLTVNTAACAQCVESGCCGIGGRCGSDPGCQACVRRLGTSNPCTSGTNTTYDQLLSTCFGSTCKSSCSGG